MTSDRLLAAARPMFNMWEFRQIGHPTRGRPIWIPQGMGLRPYQNKNGLSPTRTHKVVSAFSKTISPTSPPILFMQTR